MDEEVLEVSYDASVPCVVMVWRGYATSKQFRENNEEVLVRLRQHKATKLLADITHFKLIAAEDQEWLNENWIPRALQAGLRAVGMVSPVYYFNKVAVQNVAEKLPDALKLQYFEDREAARRWLMGA